MILRYLILIIAAAAVGITACDPGTEYVGEPPGLPHSPTPDNGAGNVPLDTILGWACETPRSGQTLTYDVYLGTENPPPRRATSVTEPTYNPGQLFPGTRYYWKIAAYDNDGLVTEGPIWHFTTKFGSWATVGSPTTADLKGIAFADTGEGWAVGNDGTILRYNDGSWAAYASPTTADLNSVAVSSVDGWAVGAAGTVLRLSGGMWTDASPGISADLRDVGLAADGSGWFVGDGGTIYNLVSGNWSPADLGDTVNLYCTAVYDDGNAWAGGSSNSLYEWDGSEWSKVSVPAYDPPFFNNGFRASAAYQDTAGPAVWAAGYGVYFSNYAGGGWTFSAAPTSNQVNGMHIAESADYGWAVGEDATILFFDGLFWSIYSPGGITSDLNAVYTLSKNEAWAVGDSGVIYRFSVGNP